MALSTAGMTLKIIQGMKAVINMIAEPTSIDERSASPEATSAELKASAPSRKEMAMANLDTMSAMAISAPRRAIPRVPAYARVTQVIGANAITM